MIKMSYRYFSILGIFAFTVFMFGCSDPVSKGDNSPIIDGRVVVLSSPTAPPLDDPNNEIWHNASTGRITLGSNSDYSDFFGEKTILIRMIRTADRLFCRFEWLDNDRSRLPNYLIHSMIIDSSGDIPDTVESWVQEPSFLVINTSGLLDTIRVDQDRMAIMWDMGKSGTEKANCALMCHSAPHVISDKYMYTAAGDSVDVWHWQAGTTDPILHAADEIWNDEGWTEDPHTIPLKTSNFNKSLGLPAYMHTDTTDFSGSVLFAHDTLPFDAALEWQSGQILPGYVLHEDADGSAADVYAFSIHAASSTGGRWMVMMSRALSTGNPEDIDFSTIAPGDSVQVTVMVADNADRLHSGSEPFYIIFP